MTMQDWGFDGIICTDAGALTNMVTQHKYFPDIDRATAGAIRAGINQFWTTTGMEQRARSRRNSSTSRKLTKLYVASTA